ncbi:zinc finger BED domain-containing DAYSLEEPER-like [Brachionus plicatilis]|uniref:Zinc finger BED domain-containing DAYSLEEPER-like n=1 Tax=Brachionus plicatilis TaxID=10195 RepID=A0A3M7QP40_BRAPC|nr:zinc finger BED domain-containing DAYSLEEPER-like [Brachionus plicatilis]
MSSNIRARGRGRGRTSRINTVPISNSVEPVSGVMTRNQRRLFLLEQEVVQTDNSNQFEQKTRNNRRSSIDSVDSISISNESKSFTTSSNGTNYPCQDLGNVYAISSEELRVIGMVEIAGSSNAEKIKESIEQIVNGFSFDKKKITCVVCDSASYLIRLFRQNENDLFDLNLEIQDIRENGFLEQNEDDDDDDVNKVIQDFNYNDEEDVDFVVGDSFQEESAENESDNTEDNEDQGEYEVDDENEEMIPEASDYMNLPYVSESDNEDDNIEDNLQLNNEPDLDNTFSDSINFLNIQLGTNNVPRYSCAAHKINLAVRSSIKSVGAFVKILSKLSNYRCKYIRSSVLCYDFSAKKAKLRCENGTRWSSSYLMLVSFYLAFEKNAFNLGNLCPISQNKIIDYLKILHPLYMLSLFCKMTDWHIGDLLPSLIVIIHATFNTNQVRGNIKKLVDELINSFKRRFNFEIESKIYQLAALLNTSKLDLCFDQDYGLNYKEKALNTFTEAVIFLLDNDLPASTSQNCRSQVLPYDNRDNQVFRAFINSNAYETPADRTRLSTIEKINREKELFFDLIRDQSEISKSTQTFWSNNSHRLPIFSNVAKKIFSIPASSAFVERYFSVCGVIFSSVPSVRPSVTLDIFKCSSVNVKLWTAPNRASRRILILESVIGSVALAGAEREVPSVYGAPCEIRSTELGSIGTQHAM